MPYFPPPGSFGIAQTANARISADTTTSSATWVDLLSITLTAGAGFLIFVFTGNFTTSANNKQTDFRVTVDGVQIDAGSQVCYTTPGSSMAITGRVAITAGSRTVKVQWQSAGTAQCRPVTNPNTEHASLTVMEVSV